MTGEWGVWENVFRWDDGAGAQRDPDGWAELIAEIGITQPGADDQPWPPP